MKSLIKGEVARTMDSLTKHLNALSDETSPRTNKQLKIKSNASVRISNDIDKIYGWFFGDVDKRTDEKKKQKAINNIIDYDTNLLRLMVENLSILEFNAAKRASEILRYIIKNSKRNQCHKYILDLTKDNQNPIIQSLIDQYNQNCSGILHEMVKRKELTTMFLDSIEIEYKTNTLNESEDNKEEQDSFGFVDIMLMLIQNADLIISSAAFETLHYLLTNDDKNVSKYLERHCNDLFDKINDMINYDNCMVQKQLLRLLHDIITNENNYDILMKYIQNKRYLIISMDLMKKYKKNSISFEAWHIFKLFVANKHKQKDIHFVLWTNKDYLIRFLSSFHDNKVGDEGFAMERKLIIKQLQNYQSINA